MTMAKDFLVQHSKLSEKIVHIGWGGTAYPHRHTAEVEQNGNGVTTSTTDSAPDHVHDVVEFRVLAAGGHSHPNLQPNLLERKYDIRFPLPKHLTTDELTALVQEVGNRLHPETLHVDGDIAELKDKYYTITIDNSTGLVEILGDVTTQGIIKDVLRDQYLTI